MKVTPDRTAGRRGTKWRLATSAIALALIAAACGSDDDASSDTTAPTAASTEATTTTAAAETSTPETTKDTTKDTTADTTPDTEAPAAGDGVVTTDGSGPATGEEIKVMSLGTFEGSTNPSFGNLPEVKAAVKGYFDWLNAHGGIEGRPVNLIECNDQANPDVAATCARQAVDEKVAVVISPWHSANGTTIVPVLEEAGIAFINGPLSPPDFTSPISFTVGSGSGGAFGATAIGMVEKGCKKLGAFNYDVAASQAIVQNMKNAVHSLGADIGSVVVNPAASNFAGTVAEVQDGGYDCMIPVIAPNQLLPLMTALSAAGVKPQFGGYAASWTADQFKQLSEAGAEGGLYSSQFVNPDSDTPAMNQVRDVFTAAGVPITQFTQSSWVMSDLFTQVARGITGDIDAASVLDGLNKADGLELGLIPTYSTQNPITAEGFTRIFSPYAYLSILTDGVLQPYNDGEPVDASAAYTPAG